MKRTLAGVNVTVTLSTIVLPPLLKRRKPPGWLLYVRVARDRGLDAERLGAFVTTGNEILVM